MLQSRSTEISIARVIPEFFPFTGGHINHVRELSLKIDPFLKSQVIIARDVGCSSKEFDDSFPIPIIRIKPRRLQKKVGIINIPIDEFFFMVEVYRVIKTIERPDIIHAHGFNPVVFSTVIGKLLNIPVVGMLHGSLAAYNKISALYETFMAAVFKPDFALIVNSEPIAPKKFCSLWKGKTVLVNHGIDTDFYKPQIKNERIIQDLGIGNWKFLVLSISNLIPYKSIDLAIEIFGKFLKSIPEKDACLLIAGDGPLKGQLTEMVKEMGMEDNVRFLGNIPFTQIPEYISIADICIGTSIQSNMNRAILEPMAAGKPVIAFDGGGLNKLVEQGINGYFSDPGNIQDFAEKMKILYKDQILRERIGKNARNTVVEQRSWEVQLKVQLEVYDKVIKGKYV